ncbi:reverse transcriptase domain-containing protein [Tanacetum coccineum]
MDSGSRSGLQTDEETHRGAPNADRTKGKGGANHVLSRGQGIYQCSLNDRKGGQANASVLCKPCPTRAGDQLHPHGKMVLALLNASRRLKRYLQAHTIVVITDQPIKQLLSNLEIIGRVLKWKFKLEGYDIQYRPRISIKGQILVDFIMERPEEESMAELEELPEPWTLFTNGSSCIDGFGAGLILTNPKGVKFTYAMRFRFEATNNEAEYEALLAGLRIAEQMGVKNLQANVDSWLVANQVNGSYVAKESGMVQYMEKVKTLTSNFKEFSIKQVPRSENKKADALRSPHYSGGGRTHMDDTYMRVPHKGNPSERQKESKGGTSQDIQAKPVATITGNQVKKFVWDNIVCRFGLPGEICISSVKHPQTNGLVERANRSLGEGIKARLDERSKDWIGELSHVLWAHRTMIKSSNGETPFSLTYGTKAVIPTEICMPTPQTAEVDLINNDEALEINLDLIEEKKRESSNSKGEKQG